MMQSVFDEVGISSIELPLINLKKGTNLTDGSPFDDIHLYIIDTISFPRKVFLRDIDLIQAYRSFHTDLDSFARRL
jgi:hypothetical protein